MLFAIDYDYTYTEDPELWKAFIKLAEDKGHSFVCVTGRSVPPGMGEIQFPVQVNIVCAGDVAKRIAAEKAGYKVDVWIDDMPETIGELNRLSWEN